MRKIRWKWVGVILGGMVGVIVLALVVLLGIGTARANQKYTVATSVPEIPRDAAAIARGEHVATTYGLCKYCHGDNLGGKVEFVAPGLLSIPTPNLTAGVGGISGQYSDEDWVRAIQHGVGRDGHALWFMLSDAYYHLSDEDVGALIAYLKQVPPVDNQLPARGLEPMAQMLMGAGMLPPLAADKIDHDAARPQAPAAGVTAEYGGYLAHTCTECHGAQLNGKPFGPPGEQEPSPNLTPGGELGSWSEEQFVQTLRTGLTPAQKPLSPDMPWLYYGKMSDEELRALWLYLRSLPPLPQGR